MSSPKHVKLFDEETGEDRDWVLFDCHNCGSKLSVHALAYYKKVRKRGKTYSKLQVDEDSFYCGVCDFQSDPKKQSAFIKRTIEENKTDRDKFRRFPDEQYANLVNSIKARSPEHVQWFNSFIHDTGRESSSQFVELVRNTRLYKGYPKSLSDDDRIFLTWFSYASTIEEETRAKGPEAAYRELIDMIRNDAEGKGAAKK